MGVSALRMPASELSIFVSAIQKRYAGKKLPTKPVVMIQGIFADGICLNELTAKGNKAIPALSILNDATSYAENTCIPDFINTKELPQMSDNKINMDHCNTFSFMWCKGAAIVQI